MVSVHETASAYWRARSACYDLVCVHSGVSGHSEQANHDSVICDTRACTDSKMTGHAHRTFAEDAGHSVVGDVCMNGRTHSLLLNPCQERAISSGFPHISPMPVACRVHGE